MRDWITNRKTVGGVSEYSIHYGDFVADILKPFSKVDSTTSIQWFVSHKITYDVLFHGEHILTGPRVYLMQDKTDILIELSNKCRFALFCAVAEKIL